MKWAGPLVLVLLVGGCALTSPAPGGPLRNGSFSEIQPSWAMAYGRASATVGGVRVSGNGQTEVVGKDRAPIPNLVPLTLGVRKQIGPVFEVNADIGWVDSGLGLRVGLPSGALVPLVLSAGARTGKISAFGDDTYQGLVALEAYPDLSRERDGSLRLVLSLGLTGGAFQHQLALPDSFDSGSDAPHGFPVASVVRPELRLQTSIGLSLVRSGRAITVALSPWILLAAAAPSSTACLECENSSIISDFSQTWGLALLVVPSVGW
jgi:hypothetical protein